MEEIQTDDMLVIVATNMAATCNEPTTTLMKSPKLMMT